MRLTQKNLKKMNLYKPVEERDADGGKYSAYGEACAAFMGNIQPYGQNRADEDYGVDLRYAYAVFTQDGVDFKELDRIGEDGPRYEIKSVRDWGGYKRLLVEKI